MAFIARLMKLIVLLLIICQSNANFKTEWFIQNELLPLKLRKSFIMMGFYWLFQSGTSFVDLLWVFFCLVFAMPLCVSVDMCLVVICCEMGRPLSSRLWCLAVSLSLSHWYPGSGVVLD